jgi:hypothetical protein
MRLGSKEIIVFSAILWSFPLLPAVLIRDKKRLFLLCAVLCVLALVVFFIGTAVLIHNAERASYGLIAPVQFLILRPIQSLFGVKLLNPFLGTFVVSVVYGAVGLLFALTCRAKDG